MQQEADFAIQEWMNLYPKLRVDLKITFQQQKGESYYVIEDPSNSRYYRIGLLEYKFISMLNGKRQLSDIVITMIQDMQEQSFDNHEVLQILNWLNNSNLLQEGTIEGPNKDLLADVNQKASFFIFPKFGLGNPDKGIDFLLPFFRPFLGWTFFIAWIFTVSCGMYYIFSNWKTFSYASNNILSIYSTISFAVIWVFLKIIHELWHGLVCKFYGGEVREVGIMLLLLIPLGYVDTSSSWRFPSKWQRIHVSLAGMYIEIFIAAIAAIVWGETQSKDVQQICYNIIILGSITTLVFNLNPLMRFDGYYVLMDLLEEPNLYSRARAYVAYLCKRYILGVKIITTSKGIRQKTLLFLYGLLGFLWRILVYFGIFLASSIMLLGIGMIVALAVLLIWLFIPITKTLIYMFKGTKTEKPNPFRSLAILLFGVIFLVLCQKHITWQEKLQSPGVVIYKDFETVRSYCPGFVEKIHIKTGEYVKKGQVLFSLKNREKEVEIEEIKYDISIVKNFIRRHQNNSEERIKIQIAQEKLLFHQKTLLEEKKLLISLKIKAPITGHVYTENITKLLGKFVHSGEELLQIYSSKSAFFEAVILEDEIEQYAIKKNDNVNIYMYSQQISFEGKVSFIASKASYEINHLALTALGGGDLTVEQAPTSKDSKGYRLVYPHFYLEVDIPKKYKRIFRDGETGYIRIFREKKAIGALIYYKIFTKMKKFYNNNL